MATTRSRNLKLYLSSGLTAEAKANLEIIDRLGEVYYTSSTGAVTIRSKEDIDIIPADPSVGGAGGGKLTIGAADKVLSEFVVYASTFDMNGNLRLVDKATGAPSTSKLLIQYKSDTSGIADSFLRTLNFDVQGADRSLILQGDLTINGSTTLQSSGATLAIPTSGTAVLEAHPQTLSAKTIDADANNLFNVDNDNIKANAGIDSTKIGSGNLTNTKLDFLATITSSVQAQLDGKQPNGSYLTALTGDVVAAGPGSSAATIQPNRIATAMVQDAAITNDKLSGDIDRAKVAAGGANKVLINSPSGVLSEETWLAKSRGGTGQDNSSLNFPASGQLITQTSTSTLTNKTMDGATNSFSNIPYAGLILSNSITNSDVSAGAGIVYSKLNLSGGIVDGDISPTAAIAGSKVVPDFGNQLIATTNGLQFAEGGFTTKIQAAQSGQVSNLTFALPADYGGANYVLGTDGVGGLQWQLPIGAGTVTSVAISAPTIFTVGGSPVTTAGTMALNLANQSANTVWAGPSTGVPNAPSFRALVAADLPSHTHVATDISDFAESVDDRVATLLTTSSSLSWSYNDATNQLTGTVSLAPFSTSNLAEGSNQYFTNVRAYSKTKLILQNSANISWSFNDGLEQATPAIDFAGFTTDALTEGSTNLFLTAERVQDAIGAALVSTATIVRTYNDPSNTISFDLADTTVSAGSYGSGSSVPTFTVDAQGRITSASNTAISIASSAVTDFSEAVMDVVGTTLVGDSVDIDATYVDGSDSLTLNIKKEFVSAKTAVAPAANDYLLVGDTSDADNLKKVLVQDVLNLGGASAKTTWAVADGLTKVFVHNLGSTDVLVGLHRISDGATVMVDSVVRTDANTLTLTASEIPSDLRILVQRL